jgi:hypothetical protein
VRQAALTLAQQADSKQEQQHNHTFNEGVPQAPLGALKRLSVICTTST